MRDETSIRTPARFKHSPFPRRPIEPETHRSAIPTRSTVHGSEFSPTYSKHTTKLFLIYAKPGSPIFSFATPTRHKTPPHSWLFFQKYSQNQSETRIIRITRKSFKINMIQKINRKLSGVFRFQFFRLNSPSLPRAASPIALHPAFSATSYASSTSSISPASSTYAKVNSLNGGPSPLFPDCLASQSNRGAANP
jgi:hypothetical protein